MPPDVDNVERWRELAAEALAVAAQMTVLDAKRAMLDVALGYERLAELAEKSACTEKFIERQRLLRPKLHLVGSRQSGAHQLIRTSSYGPAELKVIFRAFDDAWDGLAPSLSTRSEAIDAARIKLANIILSLANNDTDDPARIKTAALHIWDQHSPSISQPPGTSPSR